MAFGLLFMSLLASQLTAAPIQVPPPGEGQWVNASVALLRYNRERCDRLAGKILSYWRSLPTDRSDHDSVNQKTVRERILRDWLAELTEARTASDVARTFLPQAAEMLDSDSTTALAQLLELQVDLCDQVAYPTGPLSEFVDKVTDTLLRIDAEARSLAQLVRLDDAVLDRAIGPYLEPLQLTGVEAEGEMLNYLARPERPAQAPAFENRLGAWYERYQTAAVGSKQSLGQYLTARGGGDRDSIRSACSSLVDATVALLEDKSVFPGPNTSLDRPLRLGVVNLQRMAAACLQGNFRRADRLLERAEHQLSVVAAHLEPYGLVP